MIVRSIRTNGADSIDVSLRLTGDPDHNADLLGRLLRAWCNEDPVRISVVPEPEAKPAARPAVPAARGISAERVATSLPKREAHVRADSPARR